MSAIAVIDRTTETVVADLAAWSAETHESLILPAHEIAYRERGGMVVDLVSGTAFYPAPNFVDFATRWADYRRQRNRPADPDALATAYRTAFADECPYPDALWHNIATTALAATGSVAKSGTTR